MPRIMNYRSFNVFMLEVTSWDYGYHKHNCYEMILVQEGRGKHRLNGVVFDYAKGDIFLLTPADEHAFDIEEKTTFIYIKFTTQYLEEVFDKTKARTWKSSLLHALSGKQLRYESIIQPKEEASQVFALAALLVQEFNKNKNYTNEIVLAVFSALLMITVRNIHQGNERVNPGMPEGEKIEHILAYINANVLDREKMQRETMAALFGMSVHYISLFVKKNTGISIQHHVALIKGKAAEKLLKQGAYTINEIAEKLGFTDASHFNKAFRKYAGSSPKAFRLQNTPPPTSSKSSD